MRVSDNCSKFEVPYQNSLCAALCVSPCQPRRRQRWPSPLAPCRWGELLLLGINWRPGKKALGKDGRVYWVEFVESCVDMRRQTSIKIAHSHMHMSHMRYSQTIMPGTVGEVALQQRVPPRHTCWSRPELEDYRTRICQHTMRTLSIDHASSLRIR